MRARAGPARQPPWHLSGKVAQRWRETGGGPGRPSDPVWPFDSVPRACGAATGSGRGLAEVDPGWTVAGRPNGGYLLALVTRAALEAVGQPDPLAVSAHFLAPADLGAGRGGGARAAGRAQPVHGSGDPAPGGRATAGGAGHRRADRPGRGAWVAAGDRAGRVCRRWTSACPASPRCPVACGPTCSTISTCGWTRPPPGGSSAVPAGGWRCGGGCGSPTGAPPTRWPCSRWSTRCPRPASSSAWRAGRRRSS